MKRSIKPAGNRNRYSNALEVERLEDRNAPGSLLVLADELPMPTGIDKTEWQSGPLFSDSRTSELGIQRTNQISILPKAREDHARGSAIVTPPQRMQTVLEKDAAKRHSESVAADRSGVIEAGLGQLDLSLSINSNFTSLHRPAPAINRPGAMSAKAAFSIESFAEHSTAPAAHSESFDSVFANQNDILEPSYSKAPSHLAQTPSLAVNSRDSAASTAIQAGGTRASSHEFGQVPLSFEANLGQTDSKVQYLSRGSGYSLFLTPNQAVLSLQKSEGTGKTGSQPVEADAVFMNFIGANPAPHLVGQGELAGKVNDFSTGDAAHAHTDIPTFTGVEYQDLYPGIDLSFHSHGKALEYDFIVAPGANPSAIRMDMQGIDSMALGADGSLMLHTPVGDAVEHAPVIYQEVNGLRQMIPGRFVLEGSQIGFQVGAYDATRPLVIDPVVSYSTFLGDNGFNAVYGIAVDSAGSAHLTGWAGSATFPTKPGAYLTTPGDGFVTKLNPQGTGLVYSTFIQGRTQAIALDSAGSAYVTGYGGLFSTTPGAFQSGNFGFDAFVTKLNPQGNGVVYTARIGGDYDDFGQGIAVDAAGDAFITGVTYNYSPTNHFPILNAVQPNWGGMYDDGFVTELNPTGSGLVFSTLLGGNGIDEGTGIAVDAAGNAYATGYTSSSNFLTTAGAWNRTNLYIDSWVTKFTHAGAVAYSTLLGGGNAFAAGIAVDVAGSAYITGDAHGGPVPTTAGAYNATGGPGFITKFNPTGSGLVYSSYLTDGLPTAIAVDPNGDAAVTGEIGTTVGAYAMVPFNAVQQNNAGGSDAFVVELNAVGSAPLIASYLGGAWQDKGLAIAADGAGSVYVAGTTTSSNFPTTAGAFQPNFLGTDNAQNEGFVTKISGLSAQANWLAGFAISPTVVSAGQKATGTVTLHTAAPAGGAVVNLTNGAGISYVTSIPATVTVPAGATSATFTIATSSSMGAWTGQAGSIISASFGGVSRSSELFVNYNNTGPTLSSLVLSASQVTGGNSLTGKVTISSAAPGGGAVVLLNSNNPSAAGVPLSVVVPSGATSASFTITTSAVSSNTPVVISGSFGQVTSSANLTVSASTASAVLSGLSLSPATVTGGTASTGTISLSSAAPSGGLVVTVSTTNASVASVPATVTVPAGATSATFTIATSAVTAATVVTLSATAGGVTQTASLTVQPAQTDAVNITRAEYRSSRHQLRVNATSSSSSATLKVCVTSTGQLIGTLTNNGSGLYSGQFTWASNPVNITVKSSLGGVATRNVTLK